MKQQNVADLLPARDSQIFTIIREFPGRCDAECQPRGERVGFCRDTSFGLKFSALQGLKLHL